MLKNTFVSCFHATKYIFIMFTCYKIHLYYQGRTRALVWGGATYARVSPTKFIFVHP